MSAKETGEEGRGLERPATFDGFHGNCGISTGIDGRMTAGWGELDDYGFWEFPCERCAAWAQRVMDGAA